MRKLLVFIMLLTAPFIGFIAAIATAHPLLFQIHSSELYFQDEELADQMKELESYLGEIQENVGIISY